MNGVPTLAQVLDHGFDYGQICGLIRDQMPWWKLMQLPAGQLEIAARPHYDLAVQALHDLERRLNA